MVAWELNKTGHAQLVPLGRIMAVAPGILAPSWVVGVSGIAFDLAGDFVNMISEELGKAVAGVVLAGLLLILDDQGQTGRLLLAPPLQTAKSRWFDWTAAS
jgi:hypothetical protein